MRRQGEIERNFEIDRQGERARERWRERYYKEGKKQIERYIEIDRERWREKDFLYLFCTRILYIEG